MKKNKNGYPEISLETASSGSVRGVNDGNTVDNNFTVGDSQKRAVEEKAPRAREGCSRGGASADIAVEDAASCDQIPLAYAYAPVQKFCMLYSNEQAIKHGTLFENLYKPMEVYGRE